MKLTIKAFAAYRVSDSYHLSSRADLVASTGRVTVISGESGTGKSVLLQALSGYRTRATPEGDIDAFIEVESGSPPETLGSFLEESTRFSYLPQHTVLRPALTPARAAADWCALITAAYGRQAPVREFVSSACDELKEQLFSEDERERLFESNRVRIRHLSGGQKRRLDVLMALCSPAELILLDEPDTGLDTARRRALFHALVEFAATHGKIVLLVSHYAGNEFREADVDLWLATRHEDGSGAVFSMEPAASRDLVPLRLHEPPPERGNQRLDQFVIYVRQRLAALEAGRAFLLLLAPVVLLAAVRLAMYPSEFADGPSMGLLFFFSITCFWLGSVQATGFWSDERILFNRECRQGTSSFAFLLSFLAMLAVVIAAQVAAGSFALKFLSWSELFAGRFGQLGGDLHVRMGRIAFWGLLSGLNGAVAGHLLCTLQHWKLPQATSPGTAQLLALWITLAAIVFSFPIVGSRAYAEITEDPFAANRLRIAREALQAAGQPDVPGCAILLAELPISANPCFHGLWFQAERPLRYGMDASAVDNMQKEGVPEALINLALLACMIGAVLVLGRTMKRSPVPA